MNDSDDSWLDALAGRSGGSSSADANSDGRSLREAIQKRRDAEPPGVPIEDAHREEILIERARGAGLLSPRVRTARRRAPASFGWLAAAALAGVCVITWETLQRPTVPIVRGTPTSMVRLQSADPLKLKQDLLRELKAAGISASGYERFGRQGIDADLPTPVPPAVLDILRRHAIAVPLDGALQVEIESSSGR